MPLNIETLISNLEEEEITTREVLDAVCGYLQTQIEVTEDLQENSKEDAAVVYIVQTNHLRNILFHVQKAYKLS